MNEAVFVSGITMSVAMSAIMVVGLLGGVILVICEKIAAKNRPEH